MWEGLREGAQLWMAWDTVGMISLGLLLGMLVGALPGFTTTMAMAILLPISFFLPPLVGIPFLIGVYKGGIFGGSISAILIGIPGTGSSIVTVFDGHPLAKKGQGRKALDMALYASVFGDFSSDILTLLMIAPIAFLALKIRPPELTAVILFALFIISGIGTSVMVKRLIMCGLGLLISMIGQDPAGFMTRFAFGSFTLKSGIPFIPMLIGLFAIPQILLYVEREAQKIISEKVDMTRVGERLRFHEFRRCFRTILRSTGIGTAFGACPGIGQVAATFVAYAAAKNASKHPETFGHGELEGVAAPEAANNAVNGPTLVPLLTLGIPGDNITAILLGAFVAQGLRPGPQLFAEQGPLVYGIIMAMIAANILFLILGYFAVPVFARIITIRQSALLPVVFILAFAGTYVYRSEPMDLVILLVFGIFGYAARKFQFDYAPMVMAFILGPSLEYAFGQTMNLAEGRFFHYIFTERPIAAVFFSLIPVLGLFFIIRSLRKRRGSRTRGKPS